MRARFVVRGRVQGVGYRASTQHQARELGLTGWVRNLPDGAVELEAQGAAEIVAKLEAWLRNGPMLAKVTALVREDVADVDGDRGFEIR